MDPLKTEGESASKEDWAFLESNSRGRLTIRGLLDSGMAKRPELIFLFAMRTTGEPKKKKHGSAVSAVRRNTARGHASLLTAAEKSRGSYQASLEQEAFRRQEAPKTITSQGKLSFLARSSAEVGHLSEAIFAGGRFGPA